MDTAEGFQCSTVQGPIPAVCGHTSSQDKATGRLAGKQLHPSACMDWIIARADASVGSQGQALTDMLSLFLLPNFVLQLAYSNPSAAEGWTPGPQPEVLMGVCASDSRLGLRALKDWCQAMDLEYVMPDCKVRKAEEYLPHPR